MTITSSGTLLGAQDSFHSASVNCGNVFHMLHAVLLPYTTKLDTACITASKSMKHWESCTSFDPSLLATLWAAKYRKCLPVTNASHSSTGSLKGLHHRYGKYYYVYVYCPYKQFFMTMMYCMASMQQHAGVQLIYVYMKRLSQDHLVMSCLEQTLQL